MVQDLKDFMAKVQDDRTLQDKMAGIIKESTPENVFDNCNAVAAEMGYTITQDDLQAYADGYQAELDDDDLDKVAGGYATPAVVTAIVATSVAAAATAAGIGTCIANFAGAFRHK